jgi:hypothetical protein
MFVLATRVAVFPMDPMPDTLPFVLSETQSRSITPQLTVITSAGVRLVLLDGQPAFHIELSDLTHDRYVAVQLYLSHRISQKEIAAAWQVTIRTINQWVASFRKGGVADLVQKIQGRPEALTPAVCSRIQQLRSQRFSIREIAQLTKVSPRSVNSALAQGAQPQPELPELQTSSLDEEAAELKVLQSEPTESGETTPSSETIAAAQATAPASLAGAGEPMASQPCGDPLNRTADRMAAYLGFIEDAPPIFAPCPHVKGAGALLAIALFASSGFLENAQTIYRTMGPAFYGLRGFFLTLFCMAVLRVKNPEQINKSNPLFIGRLLGLDRVPAVKTLRRKLRALAARKKAAELMNLRAKELMAGSSHPEAVLYVDGHVQCYYGGSKIGKVFSTSKQRVVKGGTDYWVNLADATPLLCLPTPFNERLNQMLPELLRRAREVCGQRRITVIFDRGGAEAKVYQTIINLGADFIAYHKQPAPVEHSLFVPQTTKINDREYAHAPLERTCQLPIYETDSKGTRRKTGEVVELREIIIKRDTTGTTHVITPIRDRPAILVCGQLFNRWTQEIFFKHMIGAYDLDHLYTYRTERVPAGLDHPNPEYTSLQKQRANLRGRIGKILGRELDHIAQGKLEALVKLHQGKKGVELKALAGGLKIIEEALKLTPRRESAADYEMLESETRLLCNLVKMSAWQVEGELARIVGDIWQGTNGNERGLVVGMIQSTGALSIRDGVLQVDLEAQSTPERTRLLAHLCEVLSARRVTYPGSTLRLSFAVAQPPARPTK